MSAPALEVLAAEARRLITNGQFLEAQKAVLAYCHALENVKQDDAAAKDAREFMNWAVKTTTAMRSHALLRRFELSRASAYGSAGRRVLKTWEITS